jgi:hypothetical protein
MIHKGEAKVILSKMKNLSKNKKLKKDFYQDSLALG